MGPHQGDLRSRIRHRQPGIENRSPEFIAAHNKALPDIRPDIKEALVETQFAQRVHVSAFNVLRRVRSDQPVTLSGSGIGLSRLMNGIGTIVPKLLKGNEDNPSLQHLHSGFDFDNYGLSAEEFGVEDFPIGNDRAFGTLRVRVRPSPDTQPA